MINMTRNSTDAGFLSDTTYTCMGVYLTLLGLCSVICNGLVIFVLVKGKPRFNYMHHALLLNLAVADFLISLLAYPLSSSSSFAKRWLFTDTGCTFYGFFVFCLAMVDMNTLACMAICRYIVACRPGYEYVLDKKNVKYFLAVIWSYAVVWTGAPLVGWSKYTQEAYGTSCTINWYGRTDLDRSYNITITFTCFVIHIVIYAYCYINIIRTFKKADSSAIGTSNLSRTGGNVDVEDTYNLETVVWYHRIITSRKVTMMSLAMVTSYIFTWTPYAIISLYVMYADDVPAWLHILPTMLAKSSTLSNAVIYSLLSKKFREATKRIFTRRINAVQPVETGGPGSEIPIWKINHQMEMTRYRAHFVRNGVYIGKNEVVLPKEVHLI